MRQLLNSNLVTSSCAEIDMAFKRGKDVRVESLSVQFKVLELDDMNHTATRTKQVIAEMCKVLSNLRARRLASPAMKPALFLFTSIGQQALNP